MKRLTVLGLLLLCALPVWGQTASIAGNLKDIGVANATAPGAYVEFELRNYGSNIPRVSGTTVVAIAKKRFNPDASGVISGTLYRNDNITPAGTFYRVCVFDAGRQFRCADYTIAAATFDLNSATPITTSPVVTPPTGDTTYLRTDGGNTMAGNIIPNTAGTRTLGNSGARFDAVLDDVTLNALNVGTQTVTFSATPTFDTSASTLFRITLTGNVTSSTISNAVAGRVAYFTICQDGTGGRTFAWPASVLTAPTVGSGVSVCTSVSLIYDGTNWRELAPSSRGSSVFDTSTIGKLNNIIFVDGVKYPFTAAGLQACINDATPYKVCDASAMPSFASTAQINVGNTSAETVTLIVPNGSTWSFNITDGTSCGIKQFNKSTILSYATAANGITFRLIPANASVNMEALYCTENSPAGGGSYMYAEGFMAENTVGATLAKGAIVLRELFDNSSFRNLTAINSNGVGIKIYEVCCATSFYNLLADGRSGAGAKPVRIGDSTLGAFITGGGAVNVGFYGLSATHPGNGLHAIELGDSTNTSTRNAFVENVQFYNVYMEPHSSDTTTAGMKIWDDVHGIGVYGGSFTGWGGAATAYAIDLDSWAGPSNSTFFNVKSQNGNVINDNITGKTITGAANYGQAVPYISGGQIVGGTQEATRYNTAANCSSSASPAVCAAASAGSVVIAAAATTVTVNTTAVTANSQVHLTFDSSLGTKLSVTCNTTYVDGWVSARTAATSFVITVASAPTTNPACFSYKIVN